ncbi:uncharacterized protein LOC144769635 [Lissotriton helveticus]
MILRMICSAMWLIALGIDTGLMEVRQQPKTTAALSGTNVSFTCWNQSMNSTTCSGYIYNFIRNPNVCVIYPKSVADPSVSQYGRISVTCDKKSNIATVFLHDLLISDSDTYYCRLSKNGKVKEGSGTQILVYGYLHLMNTTNNNTITLSCSTVIPLKGNFTIKWKRDEDVLHWILYNITFRSIGNKTHHVESILKVGGLRTRNTAYSCQLWLQDDVLQERTITLHATALFFIGIMITTSKVYADNAPFDLCIICTPNMRNVPCHNKDNLGEIIKCLKPVEKVSGKEYICEDGTTDPFIVKGKQLFLI